MDELNRSEWLAAVGGFVLFVGGAVAAGVLHARDSLTVPGGAILAVVAIVGEMALVGAAVRALLRSDTEGVERQDAAAASMVTVLVVVVGGLAYSLLEAFAGLPRVTAAVPAAVALATWVVSWTWLRGEARAE